MASTMARTSCSEAFTSGRSGRAPGVSDEVLMQFLRPRIYRSTWAGERQQEAPQQNSLWGLDFTQSGRRDLTRRAEHTLLLAAIPLSGTERGTGGEDIRIPTPVSGYGVAPPAQLPSA